jgi:hypothetical protein
MKKKSISKIQQIPYNESGDSSQEIIVTHYDSSINKDTSSEDEDIQNIQGTMLKDEDNSTIMEEMREQILHNQGDSSNIRGDDVFIS